MKLIKREPNELLEETLPVGSHFLDSGAFTLKTFSKRWAAKEGKKQLDFYESPLFFKYMDDYALFIKTYEASVDVYANIDVIGSPELSWRNLKYLEKKHGLTPVPVVHAYDDFKWIMRYLKAGYEYLGFGGLAGRKRGDGSQAWLDQAFNIICDTPNRHPKIKIHGFGIGEFGYLFKYPWFSVDSAGWSSGAAFGTIIVPRKRGGIFRFDMKPYLVVMSDESPTIQESGATHFLKMSKGEQQIVLDWLEFAKVPLGSRDKDKQMIEQGVTSYHTYRRLSNMIYYYHLQKVLPGWQRPFHLLKRNGLGLN
jgi:hypothetical protein